MMIRFFSLLCFVSFSGVSYAQSIGSTHDLCAFSTEGHEVCLVNYILEKEHTKEIKVQFYGNSSMFRMGVENLALNTHEPELYFSGSTLVENGSEEGILRKVFLTVTYFPELGPDDNRVGDIFISDNGSSRLNEDVTFRPVK